MLKTIVAQFSLALILMLVLNACASISGQPNLVKHNSILLAAPSEPVIEPLPINTEPLKLQVPALTVAVREVPFRTATYTLTDRARIVLSETEITCMAHAIYFEARGEGSLGMTGVGYVVVNRMGHAGFPKTACGVVYQKNRRRCEFSWVCDGIPDRIRQPQIYEQARTIAIEVMSRKARNPVGDSVFFRHRSIKGRSTSTQRLYASIGNHNFFASLR